MKSIESGRICGFFADFVSAESQCMPSQNEFLLLQSKYFGLRFTVIYLGKATCIQGGDWLEIMKQVSVDYTIHRHGTVDFPSPVTGQKGRGHRFIIQIYIPCTVPPNLTNKLVTSVPVSTELKSTVPHSGLSPEYILVGEGTNPPLFYSMGKAQN